jgi:WD40 repeat protein
MSKEPTDEDSSAAPNSIDPETPTTSTSACTDSIQNKTSSELSSLVSSGRNSKRIYEPERENSLNSDEITNEESDTGIKKYQKESKRPKSEPPEEATSTLSNSKQPTESSIVQQKENYDSDNASETRTNEEVPTKSNKSESFTTKTAKKPSAPASPAPAKRLTDPSTDEYWKNIYNTDYFKEKSLKIFDIMGKEFGYSKSCGRVNLFGAKKQAQTAVEFMHKGISSLSNVQRMKMLHSLTYHDGCVNSLNFNRIGTLLASGSDDFHVGIWDWSKNTLILTFDSGHKSNVFQTKFMPFTGDSQIVTCARDGQVRLALISTSGSHIGTKKLAKHADSCHKLSIECKHFS